MKTRWCCLLLLAAGMLSGCDRPEKEEQYLPFHDHLFYWPFDNPEVLHIDYTPPIAEYPDFNPWGHLLVQSKTIKNFYLPPERSYADLTDAERRLYWLDSYEKERERDRLRLEAGDVGGWNQQWAFLEPALHIQTRSVDIVSDSDYDALHPAGTLLNDLFQISYTCADGILAHYREGPNVFNSRRASQIASSLTDFNQLQPTYFICRLALFPTQGPAQSGTHRFTVTYSNVEGKVLSVTTEPVFIQATP